MAEILKDVFLLRMNVNSVPTDRLGAFSNIAGVPIVSSTNAAPVVMTVGSTATFGAVSDVINVWVFNHATNTRANGEFRGAVIASSTTITLTGSTGNGVGGATGNIYRDPARYIPCFEDGFQVGESVQRVDVPTQHKDRGIRWAVPGDRNRNPGTIRTPLFPEQAGFILKMPVTLQAGGSIPQYHGAEEYWNGTLQTGSTDFLAAGASGTATGRGALGMICQGWTINFDRQATNALEVNLDFFINQEPDITAAIPSPLTGGSFLGTAILGWPLQDPYLNTGVYVDLEFANYLGNFVAWTGDRADVRTIQIQFSQNLELDLSRPNSTSTLDNTWTKVYSGTPTCTVNATLIMQHSDYIRLTRLKALRKARCRLMAVSSNPNGTATSLTNLALAGTTLTMAGTDSAKFHVGDVIIVEKASLNLQQVVEILTINHTTHVITFAACDVAMNGSTGDALIIRNTAWEVKVHTMDVSDRTPPTAGGAVKVVSLVGSARITPSTTTLIALKAYDDDFLDSLGG